MPNAYTKVAGLMLAVALLGAGPCHSDSSTGPTERGPGGTYSLRTIGNNAPPVEIHHGPWFIDGPNRHFYEQFVLQVTSATIEMDNNANYRMAFNMSYVGDGVPGTTVVQSAGSYTVNGSEILFLPSTGGTTAGRLQNGSIVLTLDFMQKQKPLDYTFRR
jgi:hypothetical protein